MVARLSREGSYPGLEEHRALQCLSGGGRLRGGSPRRVAGPVPCRRRGDVGQRERPTAVARARIAGRRVLGDHCVQRVRFRQPGGVRDASDDVPQSSLLQPSSFFVERWPTEMPLFVLSILASIPIWFFLVFSVIGIVYAVFIGAFLFIVHLGLVARVRGSGVRLSQEQFPELHDRVQRLAREMGIAESARRLSDPVGGHSERVRDEVSRGAPRGALHRPSRRLRRRHRGSGHDHRARARAHPRRAICAGDGSRRRRISSPSSVRRSLARASTPAIATVIEGPGITTERCADSPSWRRAPSGRGR